MSDPIITTTSGQVRGLSERGIVSFKGIPYGFSTAGAGRWRAPQPPQPWLGLRDALEYGPSAPQNQAPVGTPSICGPTYPMGEDCLVLNLWTPGLSGKRPVMVRLHGGGFTGLSASGPYIEGRAVARRGDVVVVSLNHRLGVLGYLSFISAASSSDGTVANAGMLDLVLALTWVRENIAAFGGDPANVTLFGESGGGAKILTLMGMPAAQGLFQRAICESGPFITAPGPEEAARQAEMFMAHVGIATLAELRAAPLERILAAQNALLGQNALGIGPVLDAATLLAHPFIPACSPSAAAVPLLIGTNLDELTTFLSGMPGFSTLSEADARVLVTESKPFGLGARGKDLYDAYSALRPQATPTRVAVAVLSDWFRLAAIKAAESHVAAGAPTWMYLLTWQTAGMGGILGALHGLDVPLIMHNLDTSPFSPLVWGKNPSAELQARAWKLSDRFCDACLAFARTGNPEHPGLPAWPQYNAKDRATMLLDDTCRVEQDPYGTERRAWDDIEL
jgi:para-nitrobenzyl esterase